MFHDRPAWSPSILVSLDSIAEALLPSLSEKETDYLIQQEQLKSKTKLSKERESALRKYAKLRGNDENVKVSKVVEEYFNTFLPWDSLLGSQALLYLLSTWLGTFILSSGTTAWYGFKSFPELSCSEREYILNNNFRKSWLWPKRQFFKAIKGVLLFKFVGSLKHAPATDGSQTLTNLWNTLSYNREGNTEENIKKECKRNDREIFDYTPYLLNHQLSNGNKTFKVDHAKKTIQANVDVVIVGSGCGGSVAAANLTLNNPGLKVMVVEKADYYSFRNMPNDEAHSFENMYERGAALVTEDTGIALLAGSTLGGGSAVNWACCLDTPSYVRDEWANVYGLDRFSSKSKDFDEALRIIRTKIGKHTLVNT